MSLTINRPPLAASDDTRIASITRKLRASFERFAAYNPYHAKRSWADIKWRGRYYVGYLRYSSNQGTTTHDVVFCD